MTDPRPLCKCHGEPMSKNGLVKSTGTQRWRCAHANRAKVKKWAKENAPRQRAREKKYQRSPKGLATARLFSRKRYHRSDRPRMTARFYARRKALGVPGPGKGHNMGQRELLTRRLDANIVREREYDALDHLMREGKWKS